MIAEKLTCVTDIGVSHGHITGGDRRLSDIGRNAEALQLCEGECEREGMHVGEGVDVSIEVKYQYA